MENASFGMNLVWVAICVAAFTWFLATWGLRVSHRHRITSRRALALSVALLALFPCVSASDDLVQISQLAAQFSEDSPIQSLWRFHQKQGDEVLEMLAGLLESLESAQISEIVGFSVSLCLFALTLIQLRAGTDRFLPSCAGRAPPVISL